VAGKTKAKRTLQKEDEAEKRRPQK